METPEAEAAAVEAIVEAIPEVRTETTTVAIEEVVMVGTRRANARSRCSPYTIAVSTSICGNRIGNGTG